MVVKNECLLHTHPHKTDRQTDRQTVWCRKLV